MDSEQSLSLTNRKKGVLTGVFDVEGFTAERICLILTDKSRMKVSGNNLKITAFSKQTGQLSFDGNVSEIKYGGQKVSFIKRVLK